MKIPRVFSLLPPPLTPPLKGEGDRWAVPLKLRLPIYAKALDVFLRDVFIQLDTGGDTRPSHTSRTRQGVKPRA